MNYRVIFPNIYDNNICLGDLMFQYAISKIIAYINNTNVITYPFESKTLLSIDMLNKYFKNIDIDMYSTNNNIEIVKENNKYQYIEGLLDIKLNNDLKLEGYFQNSKYYVDNEEYVKQLYQFRDDTEKYSNIFINNIRTKNIDKHLVSIHFPDNTFTDQDILNCFNFFNSKTKIYLLFSNKKESVEKISSLVNKLNIDYFYWINEIEIVSMCIMTKCDHNIINGSSLSWWGCFLNKNKEKIIIIPESWNNNENITSLSTLKNLHIIKKDNSDIFLFKKNIEDQFLENMSWENFGLLWTIKNKNTYEDINNSKKLDELFNKIHFSNYKPVYINLEVINEHDEDDEDENKNDDDNYEHKIIENDDDNYEHKIIENDDDKYRLEINTKVPYSYVNYYYLNNGYKIDEYFILDFIFKKYKLEVSGIIHVGAHECEEMEEYLLNGINPENIYWIEAIEENIDKSKKKYKNLNIYNASIDIEDNNEVIFNITNNYQSSSILELGCHKEHYPDIYVIDRVKKITTRMDTFIEKNNIPIQNINFINLDIQGVELRALKSMEKYLKYINYISTEVNLKEVYIGCNKMEEIDNYVKKFGFKRVETRIRQEGWGEAFYIKK